MGQGTVAGRGLLSVMTVCTARNQDDCVDTINQRLQDLVAGTTPFSKEHLLLVSADDLVIGPAVIRTIQGLDLSQQGIVIHKLAQEVAMQRVVEKALMARDILQAGRQAPAIAINRPAQLILQDKMTMLDSELRLLSFNAQVRKQMMSDTLLNLMDYATPNNIKHSMSGPFIIHSLCWITVRCPLNREVIKMALGVQSYPELYTTLLGWQMYDEIWELLSQTGLAFLPFMGIVLRNITHPYTSQETKDAGSTSLRRMEVDFISTLLFIFFAVSPALTLAPSVLYYTPLCQTHGKSSSYHPGNTGTTYDQAFTVPTGDIRVPLWWYAVMAFSEGITAGANTLIACAPDLRKMTSQVAMAKITDPALKQEVQEFEQTCFIPARTQYLADIHSNNPVLTPIISRD